MKVNKILDYAPEKLKHLDHICGVDEVGRGCGAGPVVTAAVILPKGFSSPLLRDSKKLSDKKKKEAYDLIMSNAISVCCYAGSVSDIDTLGINQTTFNTMRKCISDLSVKPDYVLLDGVDWDNQGDFKVELVPKGDDTYLSIAAASIVAKVKRDEYMIKLHDLYPNYGWDSNKGYITEVHINGLKENGACKYHRKKYIKKFI